MRLAGIIVGLLAVTRYQQTFGRNSYLNNLRRVYLGMQMIARGDVHLLVSKTRKVLTSNTTLSDPQSGNVPSGPRMTGCDEIINRRNEDRVPDSSHENRAIPQIPDAF